MKKILLFASALAGLFLAASCQQEKLEPVMSGNTVTYTVQVADAVATRGALGDDITAVNELVYEVYRTVDEGETDFTGVDNLLYHKTAEVKNGVATIEIEFVNDQNFTVLFWAHTKDNGVYNVENLTKVTITSPDVANNVNAQAFVGRDFVRDCVSEKNGKVTLVRPVSQLNIATTPESLVFEAEDGERGSSIRLDGSSVKVTGLATSYNIATLSAFGAPATEYEYTETAVPTDVLPVNGVNYTYVAMNYVGFAKPAEDGKTLVTVSYVINTSEGDIKNTIENVPVMPNFRTNIIGNLITSKTDYTITLEDEWYTPENVYSVWDGHTVTEPAIETNAAGEPVMVIDEASDLAWLAQIVNGTLSTRAATIAEYDLKLAADIDLANHQWTPIGTEENYFKGTFDGNNYTIKNLNVVVTEAKEGKAFIGFFGYAKDATIKNLNFENVNLNIACLDIDHSQGHIGAVAGSLEGTSTIENVTVKGDIKVEATVAANGASRVAVVAGGNSYGNVTMKNVHVIANDGSYLKANNNVGALAGQLQGKSVFENCSSNIDVTGTKFFAGGIIGIAAGDQTFTNCHTTGDITITAGRSGKAHDHYRVGGIAGGWADGAKNVCTLTNCSYTGELSGTNADGSVAEAFDYAGYVGRGYTLNGCQGSKVVIDGVEYVQAYNTAAEAGVYIVNGYYEIAIVASLKTFAAKVNAGDTFEGKTVKLAADLDLKNEQWMPIGYWQTFNGTFDGQNHTISNLKHHGTEADCYVGLFGYTENATIKNLTINNVDIKLVADNSWAGGHMGALVGNADGTIVIENINVTGDVKIDGDLTQAGAGRIGGVVGGNTCTGTIKNVVVNANAGSFVKGNSSVGGIAGQLQPSATGGELTFENCPSNIDVTAQQFYAGGIIGLAAYGTSFTNCSTSGNISVLAGRSGNANDLYRVGGIAGGWDDGADKVLSLVNCSTTCELSGQSVDGKTATSFDCGGFVGRGYSTVVGAKVIVNGTEYIYAGDGKYADANGFVMIAPGLGQKEKTYAVSSAEGLVAMSKIAIKGGESVILTADIDLTGVEFNGLDAFNPESNNTFDGQGHTVSNWTYTGGAADMAFIKNWVGTIKNVTIEGASLKTAGRSAVLAAKVYANIENCHVVGSRIEDSYWACGVIAGLYNSGSIKNCSVDGCYVKSNGGVGGIVGVINESAGERNIEGCAVKNTTVYNTGVYGESYSGALVAGLINVENATINFNNCTLENNTKEGNYVGDLFYSAEGNNVFVDGVQQ